MRKIIEIMFYVLSGFFLHSAILCSFIEAEYIIVTLIFFFVLCVLAIITFDIGQRISKSLDLKRRLGIVVLSSSGFALFGAISLFCLLNSQDFYEPTSHNTANIFNNFIQGSIVSTCFLASGCLLIRSSNRKAEQPCVRDGEDHAAPNT